MLGCAWIVEHFAPAYPWTLNFKTFAPLIGFVTLVYPAYVMMAWEPPKQSPAKQKTKQESNKNLEHISDSANAV